MRKPELINERFNVDPHITWVKNYLKMVCLPLAGLVCARHTQAPVVVRAGSVWGLEEGCESRKLGDDKLGPQLSSMVPAGTVQHF